MRKYPSISNRLRYAGSWKTMNSPGDKQTLTAFLAIEVDSRAAQMIGRGWRRG
jgi:hypothetical protein